MTVIWQNPQYKKSSRGKGRSKNKGNVKHKKDMTNNKKKTVQNSTPSKVQSNGVVSMPSQNMSAFSQGAYRSPANMSGSGGNPPANTLNKMTELERERVVTEAFQLVYGCDPVKKDFDYYKYSIHTPEKLRETLLNSSRHRETIENGNKFEEVNQQLQEIKGEMVELKSRHESLQHELDLLNKVLDEKNQIIQMMRENFNKFSQNEDSVRANNGVIDFDDEQDPVPAHNHLVAASQEAQTTDNKEQPQVKPLFGQPLQSVLDFFRDLISKPY